MKSRLGLALAVVSLILPQNLSAACLSEPVHQAGQVRELETMLASVVLRCRTIQIELQPRYDQFRIRQKDALAEATAAIRAHFQTSYPSGARAATDRFFTKLANLYGAGRTDEEACAMFGEVLDLLSDPVSDHDLLLQMSKIMIPDPVLAEGGCL